MLRNIVFGIVLTDEINLVASIALPDLMIPAEFVPMRTLSWRQNTAAAAEGTGIVKRRQDCSPDEIRLIGNTMKPFRQVRIRLECNDLGLFLS